MREINGAMLLALVTCALTSLTFMVFTVDLPVNTEINHARRFWPAKSKDILILSRRNTRSFVPKDSPISQENRLPTMTQPAFAIRTESLISSDSDVMESTETLLLLNYLHQFKPSDRHQRDTILQVAREAKVQLSTHQIESSEELRKFRRRITALIEEAGSEPNGGQEFPLLDRYFELLEERRTLLKMIGLQKEKIDALRDRETASVFPFSLEDEKQTVQGMHLNLSNIDSELAQIEIRISEYLAAARGDLRTEIHVLLGQYKRDMDASADQDVIVEKFESILAAAQYVEFKDI